MDVTTIPDWTLLLALAAGEALLMLVLALLYWRKNARDCARVRGYVLGTLGLGAGLGAWAAGTPGPVAPAAAPLVFAVLLAGAGIGTVLPRVILARHARADVREAVAAEEAPHA